MERATVMGTKEYVRPARLSFDDQKAIIRRYIAGEEVQDLAAEYKTSVGRLLTGFRHAGINIRGGGGIQLTAQSWKDAAGQVNAAKK